MQPTIALYIEKSTLVILTQSILRRQILAQCDNTRFVSSFFVHGIVGDY